MGIPCLSYMYGFQQGVSNSTCCNPGIKDGSFPTILQLQTVAGPLPAVKFVNGWGTLFKP